MKKGSQKISARMLTIIQKNHKFTTKPWTSKYGITYIGYGHQVTEDILKISKIKAVELLNKDLEDLSLKISKALNVQIPQNHFDVFVHLAYDFSFKALKNSSLFLEYTNYNGTLKNNITSLIMTWSKIKGQVSLAMLYRREQDLKIFLDNIYEEL